ncbi:metal ABC transporter ATP-binding protein [Sporosarcina luteola]|uniref:metal ABC transporter ATP-binding protein n=1 Tax=Sporosarcina luteola TaxID=582850 RepID=UPI00203CEAFC|nr:metal ABC transporter ATP-binding protein [Sporosarcina luteola]MCM3743688.1 metal ABC transporter ATP-binding protein [Sporosarcina luteola]
MTYQVEVRNLSVSYDGENVLSTINFNVDGGKLIGIIGPNGAGKSTLMKAILELIHRDHGEVLVDGKPMKDVRKKVAYVPQRAAIDWDFPITVLKTVLLGTYPQVGIFRRPGKSEKRWALECLQKVGMDQFANRQIGELSGGQQQRVFLARALAQKANIFFLDEPFVGIDVTSEALIIGILKELRDGGDSVFVVHHDLSKVEDYFDELLLLNKELIAFGPVARVMQSEYLRTAYHSQYGVWDALGVVR